MKTIDKVLSVSDINYSATGKQLWYVVKTLDKVLSMSDILPPPVSCHSYGTWWKQLTRWCQCQTYFRHWWTIEVMILGENLKNDWPTTWKQWRIQSDQHTQCLMTRCLSWRRATTVKRVATANALAQSCYSSNHYMPQCDNPLAVRGVVSSLG